MTACTETRSLPEKGEGGESLDQTLGEERGAGKSNQEKWGQLLGPSENTRRPPTPAGADRPKQRGEKRERGKKKTPVILGQAGVGMKNGPQPREGEKR